MPPPLFGWESATPPSPHARTPGPCRRLCSEPGLCSPPPWPAVPVGAGGSGRVMAGGGEADAGGGGGWSPEAPASTSLPSPGRCGRACAAGGGGFGRRSGPGGAAQKPLCDRRPRPWALGSGAPRPGPAGCVASRGSLCSAKGRGAAPGSGRRGPGWGEGCACHCGVGSGEGAVTTGSPLAPGRRWVGGAAPRGSLTVSARGSRSSGPSRDGSLVPPPPALRSRLRGLRQNGLGARA